jgi:hypothetical protein
MTASFNKIALFPYSHAMGAGAAVDQWKMVGDTETLNKIITGQCSYSATVEDACRRFVGYDPDNVGKVEQSLDRKLYQGKNQGKDRIKNQGKDRGVKRRHANKYFEAKAERSRRSQNKLCREGKRGVVSLIDSQDNHNQYAYL